MLSRTDIQLEGLSIVDGLDSFTVFDLLRVSGAATLRSTLALRSVQATARLRIELRPSGGKAAIVSGNAATDVEHVQLGLALSDLGAVAALVLGVDAAELGAVPLGSVVRPGGQGCLLRALRRLRFSELSGSVGDVRSLGMTGFISPGPSSPKDRLSRLALC